MKCRIILAAILPGVCLFMHSSMAQTKDGTMHLTATGMFEVTMKPQSGFGDGLSCLGMTKTFHGDLTGGSVGEMLGERTPTQGSAGYVAMELVTGTLSGKSGSFVLQHSGTLNRGAPDMHVTVVPDSGTGALAGIAGSMTIDASHGHRYVFAYTLPAVP